jgi:hypothetical protein
MSSPSGNEFETRGWQVFLVRDASLRRPRYAQFHLLHQNSSLRPLSCRLRRFLPKESQTIREELDVMLAGGVIVPSKSPWLSTVVLAPKPDGSIRFCVDYRHINAITTRDKFPLPRINECLDSLAGKSFFATLDCFAGY